MNDKYTDKQVCDILGDNHFSNLLQYVLHMFGTMPRSMTEEEITQYLKMNRKVGITLGFMPTEVQEWCHKNSLYLQIVIESKNVWDDYKNWIISKKLEFTTIVCLPEDYEIEKKEKSQSGWVEFEIKNDIFCYLYDVDNHAYSFCLNWWQWQDFLKESKENDWNFTAFGGWQYEDSKRWYLAPAIQLNDGKLWNSYVIEDYGEAKPVIPVKIRFWKEDEK